MFFVFVRFRADNGLSPGWNGCVLSRAPRSPTLDFSWDERNRDGSTVTLLKVLAPAYPEAMDSVVLRGLVKILEHGLRPRASPEAYSKEVLRYSQYPPRRLQ
jgi:hypothetical protein